MKQKIAITTDAVIFTKGQEQVFILLIKRGNNPFKNQWALPGGFVEEKELLHQACLRELKEETGIEAANLTQIGIYDAIERDPRGRTLSVAFGGLLEDKPKPKGADDAAEAHWVELPLKENLAFDHAKIIEDAIKKLAITL
ncbi:NUDIX domain-containing protein [Haloflavibacter putidus]|uniref:NUDIX hydrolase n=1 Tax=Haloflavibacter putidus TaxID=2576776 RepID=A0A507ZRM1_9FLAO|nr:NUDIX hydrolase [Haloflavibacter putidus]TQD40270.1 NUDIX hydrolase [Haloflavibacter putidus]